MADINEKIREEFKEWARSRGMSLPVNDNIHYNEWTQLAWEAWQASRSAVEIDLPFIPDPWDMDSNWANEGARRVIEAAGLRVKTK